VYFWLKTSCAHWEPRGKERRTQSDPPDGYRCLRLLLDSPLKETAFLKRIAQNQSWLKTQHIPHLEIRINTKTYFIPVCSEIVVLDSLDNVSITCNENEWKRLKLGLIM
jgi:hypothetical protein